MHALRSRVVATPRRTLVAGSAVHTDSATTLNRASVMHGGWYDPNVNHTVAVVVVGTANRPRVDVDAFIVLHDAG